MLLKSPKPEASDDRYAVFFAAISMFPWIGPILAEALKRRWPSKFEKELSKWHFESTVQINASARMLRILQAVEEGENANGKYRRIGDGMQEIEANVSYIPEFSGTISLTFPAAYAKPPIIQIFDESHSLQIVAVTESCAHLKLTDKLYKATVTFRYRAIGRWR